jgi:hypothetical protein
MIEKIPLEAIELIRCELLVMKSHNASICALINFGLVEGGHDGFHCGLTKR